MTLLSFLFVVTSGLVVIATLAPFSRRKEWWVRGWEFPRLQIAVAALVLSALLAWREQLAGPLSVPLQVVLAGCFLWQLAWILPYTRLTRREVRQSRIVRRRASSATTRAGVATAGLHAGDASGAVAPADVAPADAEGRLRLMSVNVLMRNRAADRLLGLVERVDPDVLITLESDAWWERRLDTLDARYPHACKCPLDNRYGMHVYSRLAFETAETRFLIEPGVPSMRLTIRLVGGERVRLNVVHPTPPSPTERETSRQRDAELVMVGLEVVGLDMPVVVAGDLNDVAWSRTTRRFRKISGLLDPRRGRGMFNTFHADWPGLRWPLDHVFHSSHFALAEIRRLPPIGSDHFPILVDLRLEDAGAGAGS
ncbi:MAG: endonuclease/exonuclease/phosphatase family protein [Lautropia sp.]